MAAKKIEPAKSIKGQVDLPGDKSISHRAVILGMLAKGETRITNFLTAQDCLDTLKACQQLGARIERQGTEVTVQGCGLDGLKPSQQSIDCGNSGTGVRLLSGVLAGQTFQSEITGDEQIQRRPMKRIIDPLTLMGATIGSAQSGLCPLKIKGGNLSPIHYTSPVASAQVKSCILLAGLYAKGETTVTEPSLSRDHTENMLNHFGVKVRTKVTPNVPVKPFAVSLPVQVSLPANRALKGQQVDVPSDISSAAFFIVLAAVLTDSEICIPGIGINKTRTGILDILKVMGAQIDKQNIRMQAGERVADIVVKGKDKLRGVEIYGALIPRLIDEIPILCVAAAVSQGQTIISDAAELRVKETDRITVVAGELRKIGIQIEEKEDGMIITGGEIKGGTANSHGDHRLAMSLAIAGLLSKEGVVIENMDCVNTSFPGFWEKLEAIQKNA